MPAPAHERENEDLNSTLPKPHRLHTAGIKGSRHRLGVWDGLIWLGYLID